ncbi:MAG: sulfotransferase [Opitutales bacterium]
MLRLQARLLLRGLRFYAGCWIRAFSPECRQLAPLGPRRWLVLVIGLPAALLLQAVHGLALLLDELFFPGYRRAPIREPLMITGLPRSGTTAVHRRLARDRDRFSTPATWEVLLAPAILEKQIFRVLGALDRVIGRPGGRCLAWLFRRLAGDFNAIHETGPDAPEEDYLLLLPYGGCFLAVLAFPADPAVWRLAKLDTWPAAERRLLVDGYLSLLRRHLYVFGRGRRLLSKNAAFASWLPALRGALPESRWLVCIRRPDEALSSQLSAVAGGAAALGVRPRNPGFVDPFSDTFAHALSVLVEVFEDPQGLAVVDQAVLKNDSDGVLAAALCRVGEAPTGPMRKSAESEPPKTHRSGHNHRPGDWNLNAETLQRLTRLHETLTLYSVRP